MSESNFPSAPGYDFLPPSTRELAEDDPIFLRRALLTIHTQATYRTQPTDREVFIARIAECALQGKDWRNGYAPREASHRRLTRALLHRTEGAPDARAECVGWLRAGSVPQPETGS